MLNSERMCTRALVEYQPSTIREEDMSVEFVLTTENPAQVMDWQRWEVVDEVLISKGMILPDSGKVPLQDSHSRSTVEDNLGHVREIKVEPGQVVGRLYFDKGDERAVRAFNKIRGGHIDSGSIGYEVMHSRFINDGEEEVYNGRTYEGPLKLSLKWKLLEYSLVAIGADEMAKVRGFGRNDQPKIKTEGDKMPENKTNEDVQARLAQLEQEKAEAQKAAKEATERAAKMEREQYIDTMCARHDLDSEFAEELKKRNLSKSEAADTVLEKLAERSKTVTKATTPEIVGGLDEKDKLRAAAIDGLTLRFAGGARIEKPAAGANEFRGRRLVDTIEKCLRADGIDTRHMSESEIARTAIQQSARAGVDQTTESFPYVLENVLNKEMMRGVMEAPKVWDRIARVGSTSDFKQVSRVAVSEAADLPLKREGAEYHKVTFNDRAETGQLGTYANETAVTEEVIVNDDLGFIMSLVRKQGFAAARVPETLVFGAINTPPTLTATARALYNATDGNTIDDTDGLNATNLSKAIATMAAFEGDGEDTAPLDMMPSTLLVHPDNDFTASILLNSAALPQATYSEGVVNPFRKYGMQVISSARVSTATNFYLFANPNVYDVMELLTLNGNTSPEFFRDRHPTIDAIRFRVRMRAGLVVLDWRGTVRHTNS